MDFERPLQIKNSLYEAKQVEPLLLRHLRDGYSGCMFSRLSIIKNTRGKERPRASRFCLSKERGGRGVK